MSSLSPPPLPSVAPPTGSVMSRPDFLWGVATAAFQIEGATQADGRLPSIWDTYAATPGTVLNGDTGDRACEHYHRWADDVDLIASLGVDAYRLSIAWPRVIGLDGELNHRGVDFYKRVLDRLADKGIQRYATLYHWDLPQHLEDRGGWLNRDTAYRFADYADKISRALEGRVTAWATLNEPWCSAYLGYTHGRHAPGRRGPRYAAQALHHLLLGHGLAQPALQANDAKAKRGIVVNIGRGAPEDPNSAADREAARLFEVQLNDWVLDALLKGAYPEDVFRLRPGTEPLVLEGDMDVISRPLDFLGINYYYRSTLRSDGGHGYVEVQPPGRERTQMGWEVCPEAFTELLVGFRERYANLPPVLITENGMASADLVVDGQVADMQRCAYLQRHFAAVHAAIEAGVDVRGYFVWSLLDNFEWAYGYERRFGLVHVDYDTQVRTLKHSAKGFQAFLAERARGRR